MKSTDNEESKPPSLLSVLGSVMASMFGVQSSRKREKDFVHGKAWHYIIIGLMVTVVFVLTLWAVVSIVMKLAGL